MRDFRDIFDYQKDPRGTFNSISASWYSIQLCPNNIPMISFQKGQKGCQPSHPSPLPPRPGSLKHRPELRGVDGAVVEISLMSLALRPRRWPGVGHGMLHLGLKHGTRLELPWHVLGVAVAVPGSWVPGWSHKEFVTFCFSTQNDFWWPCLGIPYFWHLMQGCICYHLLVEVSFSPDHTTAAIVSNNSISPR